MTSAVVSDLFMFLAVLILFASALAVVLDRVHVPGAIAALLVSVLLQLTPLADLWRAPALQSPLTMLVELGVLFQLFLVGLEVDPISLRGMSKPIVLLAVASSLGPFLCGLAAMLCFGYDAGTGALVGLILLPTAEIVIIPILEEFELLDTRVGRMIVSVGTLDDVFEALLLALVSVRLSQVTAHAIARPSTGWLIALGSVGFAALAILGRRYIVLLRRTEGFRRARF